MGGTTEVGTADPAARGPTGRSRPRTARGEGERGLTLVELLISISLMSVVVVGFLGSLGTLVRVSASDRKAATTEAALRTGAAELSRLDYRPCSAGSADSPYTQAEVSPPVPTGYTATVRSVRFSDGANPPVFGSTCPAAGDAGLQQLLLEVRSDDGAVRAQLPVTKRKP